jgi:hypothetical protein
VRERYLYVRNAYSQVRRKQRVYLDGGNNCLLQKVQINITLKYGSAMNTNRDCTYASAAELLVDAIGIFEGAIDGIVNTDSEHLSMFSSLRRGHYLFFYTSSIFPAAIISSKV